MARVTITPTDIEALRARLRTHAKTCEVLDMPRLQADLVLMDGLLKAMIPRGYITRPLEIDNCC